MSKTVKVTRGATLGLDLTEDWTRDNYSAEDGRARRLEWSQLDAILDARHASLAAERAERETAEAEAEARRAAMQDAAEAYNGAAEADELPISADAMAEALEAEREALAIQRAERMEWEAERADSVQEFTRHTFSAERNAEARISLAEARRAVAYQAASVMLASMPRRANVMFATRPDTLTIQAATLSPAPLASAILPQLKSAERTEAKTVASWDAAASKAEAEARISQWNKPTRASASNLETTQKLAEAATRAAHTLRREYAYAKAAPRYAFRAIPVATFDIPVAFTVPALIKTAANIGAIVPARNDVHPFPTKLGRGNVTGTTQADKPGTRLVLAERGRRVVDPFDSVAEAKREARRQRDAKRTGQTVNNRAAARLAALSDFHDGLALMETARAHNDALRVAAEREAEDKARRAEAARKRRANQTAEDKAARNMQLRNKRRAAKTK